MVVLGGGGASHPATISTSVQKEVARKHNAIMVSLDDLVPEPSEFAIFFVAYAANVAAHSSTKLLQVVESCSLLKFSKSVQTFPGCMSDVRESFRKRV